MLCKTSRFTPTCSCFLDNEILHKWLWESRAKHFIYAVIVLLPLLLTVVLLPHPVTYVPFGVGIYVAVYSEEEPKEVNVSA